MFVPYEANAANYIFGVPGYPSPVHSPFPEHRRHHYLNDYSLPTKGTDLTSSRSSDISTILSTGYTLLSLSRVTSMQGEHISKSYTDQTTWEFNCLYLLRGANTYIDCPCTNSSSLTFLSYKLQPSTAGHHTPSCYIKVL